MRFKMTVLHGSATVLMVTGPEIDPDNFSVLDLGRIQQAEQLLERITGHRIHIEEVPE